jgi:hypothetical protein
MSKNYRTKSRISGAWSWRTIEMMESPAFRVLSHSARRVLDRLEIELAHHAGNDNGSLPCTFDHFAEYGIDRHSIAPALREVEALLFIEVTERGRAGNAEYRRPNLFRLTYKPVGRALPKDEWRSIRTDEEARMLSKIARANSKMKHSLVGDRAKSQWGCSHRKSRIHSGVFPTTMLGEETHTTSISASQRVECTPYAISTDPSALNAFGTAEYRGRPFLIVNNDARKKLAPSRRKKLAPSRRTRNGKRGLRAA